MYPRDAHHLVASTNEHRDSTRVGALLNDEHLVTRSSKADLTNDPGPSKLLSREILESGHNTTVRSNSNELNLRSSNPTNCRQLVLHKQMIGLIIESPLTNHQVCTSILDHLDHLCEFLLLIDLEFLVLFNAGNVQLVLGLGPWGLEGAGEDGNLGITNGTGHLRVRHVLVDDDSLNESGVLEGSSDLSINLDELEIDIATLEIGDREHGVDSNLGELDMCLGNAVCIKEDS